MVEGEMSVETPVQEPISPDAELTTPAADPIVDTPGQVDQVAQQEPAQDEPHALDPDGKRFKQVWARAKSAESELNTLKQQLQQEREERIRYEERAKVQGEQQQRQAQPEYTWAQLQAFIDEGKVTLAQALEYREQQVAAKAKREAKQELEQTLAQTAKKTTVAQDLAKYRQLEPEALQYGSEKRQRLEQEFQYLTQTLGYPATQETELVAARTVLGPIESLEKRRQAASQTAANRETYMETQSTGKPQPKAKDPIAGLSQEAKDLYAAQIKKGMYENWDEVRKELTWTRGKK